MMNEKIYIGIDPGVNGALVAFQGEMISFLDRSRATDMDTWHWVGSFINQDAFAVIEQQTPRPTWIPTLNHNTVLASTCVLYGSYTSLRTMLLCASIPFEDCSPRRWQEYLHIKRSKGEKDNVWKGRLKEKAQHLYPRTKVTLANADALLIATYCKRMMTHVGIIST